MQHQGNIRNISYIKNYDRERSLQIIYNNSHKEERKERDNKYYSIPINRIKRLVLAAKNRATVKGIEYDREGLLEKLTHNPPSNCECCNTMLDYSVGIDSNRWKAPSLDRVDNAKGYTTINTKVICFSCNTLKSYATKQELFNIINYIDKNLNATSV